MSIVWPRSVIRGSTAVMWIDGDADNVTVRLAGDDDRIYQEKVIPVQHRGKCPALSSRATATARSKTIVP